MFPFSFLRRSRATGQRPFRQRHSHTGAQFRPDLEPLEDRMVLSAAPLPLAPPEPGPAVEMKSAEADHGAVASGHGNITFEGELRTFSFTLVQKKDGSYKGQAQLINRAQEDRVHIRIDDAAVYGNIVVMSGTVTSANKPTLDGADVLFAVRDNGPASSSHPDELTVVLFFDPGTGPSPSEVGPPPESFWMPIEGGSIQIKHLRSEP